MLFGYCTYKILNSSHDLSLASYTYEQQEDRSIMVHPLSNGDILLSARAVGNGLSGTELVALASAYRQEGRRGEGNGSPNFCEIGRKTLTALLKRKNGFGDSAVPLHNG
jgi:hypothetical protein